MPPTAPLFRRDPGVPWLPLSRRLCLLLAAVIPLSALVVLLNDWPHGVVAGLASLGGGAHAFGSLTGWLQAVLVATLMAPALLMGACLYQAAGCLASLAGPTTLTPETVDRLRRFSAYMLASALAGIVAPTVVGIVVSLVGTGRGTLSVGASTQQAILIIFAAVTWQISRAMQAAIAVADEYAQIV